MRYWLKFGDAFAARTYQICNYRWKCGEVLWPSIKHALSS